MTAIKEETRMIPVVMPEEIWEIIESADGDAATPLDFQKIVQGFVMMYLHSMHNDNDDPVLLYMRTHGIKLVGVPKPALLTTYLLHTQKED
jgi:hypothetical protein